MKGLSIIIPAWNRPDMLKESLTCLKSRSRHDLKEVIVVDDGSEPENMIQYETMISDKLIDKLVKLPYHKSSRLNNQAYITGYDNSNKDYEYAFFGADDLLYRTNWDVVLIEMIESEWAKKHNVGIISGFNHWSEPNDYAKMKKIVDEMYVSKDNKVSGYICEWGGNYFFRKDFFNSIGGFTNNLKKLQVPPQYAHSYEAVLQYKGLEMGWKWGATVDTYVQTMARPNSSSLGNYRTDAKGNKITNTNYQNGIAIGINWKDE